MTPLEAPASTRAIALQPHQTLRTAVRAGSVVLLQAGALKVGEPPRWLAETMLRPASRLDEGGALPVAERGWLELEAGGSGARLLLIEPVPAWRRLLRRLACDGSARPSLPSRLTRPS